MKSKAGNPKKAARSRGTVKSAARAGGKKRGKRIWISEDRFEFLNDKLREALETLEAIRTGVVDAVVVSSPEGNQIYSLTGAEQPYRVYVEQMQEGAVTVSADSMILYCNQRFAGMLKMPLERVISSNLSNYLEPGGWAQLSAAFNKEAKAVKYEGGLHCADGSELPAQFTASRLPMDGQEVMCLVVTDSTEQKEKAELRLAKEVAEKANAAKDAFLAALSHELRTPLNPVLLLASEGAANLEWPVGARADFESIRQNIEMESRLIDDLLDLTRIAHGKLTMQSELVDLRAILQQVVRTVGPEIEQQKICLSMSLEEGECLVKGDAIRLQQVFWNILKNAIKFTPARRGITITCRKANDGELVVLISDSGMGMTKDELRRVFENFAQGDHANVSHRYGGLGLGMAISRKLVELHSGSIQAHSDGRDLGSTFVVRLPPAKWTETDARPQRVEEQSAAAGPISGRNQHVLLIEDHEPTRLALARLLTHRQFNVTTASSVQEALALVRQQHFDLVISDIGLPDGNGFDLMRELRKEQDLQGIALTGYGMEHDVERSRESGFAAHLTKPVRVQSLEAALDRLVK